MLKGQIEKLIWKLEKVSFRMNSELLVNYFEVRHETYQTIRAALKMTSGIIAGGSAREAFLNEGFGSNDIDIYFPQEHLGKVFFELLHKQSKTVHHPYDYVKYYKATNFFLKDGTKIQCILGQYLHIEDIFNSFDFTCCQFAIKDDMIYYTSEAIEDTMNKKLVSTGNEKIKDYRLIKYVLLKGFNPTDILFEQLNKAIKNFLPNYTDEHSIDKFLKGEFC
jgi:hypothetical protein